MSIFREFNISMIPGKPPLIIHVSQYESDFVYTFNLVSGKSALVIPDTAMAVIRGTKRDGNGYSVEAALDAENHKVVVMGDVQMTACAGKNVFELAIINDEKVICTANFFLDVERAPLDLDTIQSETVLHDLQAIVDSAATATQAAQEASESAASAASAAEQAVEEKFEDGVAETIDEWLTDHPEATTTVQDGAITEPKLATALKLKVIKDHVTPEMFGAVGDGTTDDTLAIQAAITSGMPVFIPGKTYVITSGLTISGRTVITGEDQYASRLLFVGATETAITLSGDFIHFENFSIHSDDFDYSVKGTDNEYTCISATNVHYSTFNNLRVVGFDVGMRFARGWSNSFTNLIVLCCKTGFYGADEFNQILFSHCCLNWCLNAVWIQGGRTIVFDCCDIERNNIGAKIRNISDVKFIGCYFELNTNGSINIDWANKPVPICTITDCSFFENADCTGVVFYHMAESGKLIIEKCYFASNDLGETIIPIITPLNVSTKVIPILLENVINGNYSAGTKNFVDYNYMPVAVSSSDFITLNADYSLADFSVYKEGRHIYGTFTVIKTSAFVSGDNNVGVIASKYLPLQNINTYGALSTNRWQQSTNNLCYVFLSTTALAIKNGDGTSTIAKVIVNYAAKES